MHVTPPYPLVAVVWDDAATTHGWEQAEDTDTSREFVITVGFLFREDEHYVYLCSSCAEDGATNSRIKIPKGMIAERSPINQRRSRRSKHADPTEHAKGTAASGGSAE